MNKRILATGAIIGATVASAAAQATPPIDLSSAGTDIAGFVPAAAGAGVVIMVALFGIRVVKRAFKSAAS